MINRLILGGIFPIPGITGLIVGILCYFLNGNFPASIVINAIATPLNFLTIMPFILFGHKIL